MNSIGCCDWSTTSPPGFIRNEVTLASRSAFVGAADGVTPGPVARLAGMRRPRDNRNHAQRR